MLNRSPSTKSSPGDPGPVDVPHLVLVWLVDQSRSTARRRRGDRAGSGSRSPAGAPRPAGLKTASTASPFDADGPSIWPSICTAAICCRSPPRTKIAQIIGTARGSVTSVSPCSAFARFAASLLSSPSRSFSSFGFQCLSACFWRAASCFAAAASSGLTQRLPCFL